jgi:Domain of unknown function (DUF1772)
MIVGELTFATATAFAAAAIYVNVAEQPARLALDNNAMLVQWQRSYERASVMQAGLALIACVLGVAAFVMSRDWRWLVGAATILAPWPWTLLVMKPINGRLKATAENAASAETRDLVKTWGWLHAGRSAFGVVARLDYLWALN